MPLIPIDSILIRPNRQRQAFCPEALQELKSSIETHGLLHPPVCRQEPDGWVLVAGERRLRAIREIFDLGETFNFDGNTYGESILKTIPVTDIGTLTDLQAEEAELDENLKRRDLTWQEHAAAAKRLHELRGRQAQDKAKDMLGGMSQEEARFTGMQYQAVEAAQHTIADTAEELYGRRDGSYQAQTRREILVASHLDNPAIAKAKSAEEAFKILRQQETRTKNIELAQVIGATFNADCHSLYNTDCLDYMQRLHSDGGELFDVILTDPPYGMGANTFGDGAGKLAQIEHQYDDSFESWETLMAEWCPLSYAVTKPQAHAYVFCDFDNFHTLKLMMQAAGWYVFRTPLIAHKINSGRVPLPDSGPRRQYEIILYAIKGKKPVTQIYPDVISTSADDNMTHGAQKPVALFANLLQRSVRPGDRIFDPFSGTGTIFPAAHQFKCSAVGCEMNPEYYAMGLKRLQGLKTLGNPDLMLDVNNP